MNIEEIYFSRGFVIEVLLVFVLFAVIFVVAVALLLFDYVIGFYLWVIVCSIGIVIGINVVVGCCAENSKNSKVKILRGRDSIV